MTMTRRFTGLFHSIRTKTSNLMVDWNFQKPLDRISICHLSDPDEHCHARLSAQATTG